jgi:uncharacterized repeat protein (TIGR02543 family)
MTMKTLGFFRAIGAALITTLIACSGGGGGGGSTDQTPKHSVTYDGNGATTGAVPVDAGSNPQGATVTVLANSGGLARAGYYFNGWNTQANGSGTSYAPGATLAMGTASVTLYARWGQVPTYLVTYDANGATGGAVPVDNGSYQEGQTVTVLGNTGALVRPGYAFSGWNRQANGSGTSYAPAATFTMGAANVTLYAKWTLIPTYSVTYSGNGATSGFAPVDNGAYEEGATVTVLGNTGSLGLPGYAFSGWNTAANGSGTSYAPAATFTMGASDVTLYAQWTLIPTYTVTYAGNGATGGAVPVDAGSYQQGATVTVLGNTGSLVRAGYSLNGWNTQSNGSGTSYAPAATFAMGTANVTLYAQWTLNPTYTVTYDGNGNTGGTVPVGGAHVQGTTVTTATIDLKDPMVRTGYTFCGWNTQADGNGTTYAPGSTFTMGAANVTLFAMWGHTVTYDSNGAASGAPPVDATLHPPGQTVTVLGNTGGLTNGLLAFAGWNTQADGSGVTYGQGATFAMGQADLTLFARWTANPTYTVTYDPNPAAVGGLPVDTTHYEQGQIVTVLATTQEPRRAGAVYAGGWNTQADGGGTTYLPGQTFAMGTAPVVLYARWTLHLMMVPATGQQQCYDAAGAVIDCAGTGQDPVHATSPMSFADNGDGTVSDLRTGLTWQKCALGQLVDPTCSGTATLYDFTGAGGACAGDGLAGGGWRVPSRFELETLADLGIHGPAIDEAYFPNSLTAGNYSSESFYDAAGSGGYWSWLLLPEDGNVQLVTGSSEAVRCVRGTYEPPDDVRFRTLAPKGDGTLTDLATNLVWQQCSRGQSTTATPCDTGSPTVTSWEDALSYCNTLSLGGATDWRLPNAKELELFAVELWWMDSRAHAGDLQGCPQNGGGPNAAAGAWWSSTTVARDPSKAWWVDYSLCFGPPQAQFGAHTTADRMNANTKATDLLMVRCVRGP